MAAGLAMLQELDQHPEHFAEAERKTTAVVDGIKENLKTLDLPYTINQLGSMFTLFFTDKKVIDFAGATACDMPKFGHYFHEMLKRGVYLAPSQYESLFLSVALSDQDIEDIVKANYEALKAIH